MQNTACFISEGNLECVTELLGHGSRIPHHHRHLEMDAVKDGTARTSPSAGLFLLDSLNTKAFSPESFMFMFLTVYFCSSLNTK